MKPMPAESTSILWSYEVSEARSRARYSSVPRSVISYSMRGGPPAVLGATSWASSIPCFASCFSAW